MFRHSAHYRVTTFSFPSNNYRSIHDAGEGVSLYFNPHQSNTDRFICRCMLPALSHALEIPTQTHRENQLGTVRNLPCLTRSSAVNAGWKLAIQGNTQAPNPQGSFSWHLLPHSFMQKGWTQNHGLWMSNAKHFQSHMIAFSCHKMMINQMCKP